MFGLKSDKIKKLDIKIARLVDNIFLGNYKTAFKGSGIEFADIREYVPGDSFKSIDRLTSAKQSKLYIKKYEEERQLTIFFLLDIGGSMKFGIRNQKKFDTMLEIFYTLAFSGLKNNDKIGAIIYDEEIKEFIKPAKGKSTIFKITNNLINLFENNKNQHSNTTKTLGFLNSLKYRNCLVFVLTDDILTPLSAEGNEEKGRGVGGEVKIASVKNEIIYINIFDSFENNLSNEGLDINLKNGKHRLNINIEDNEKKQQYIDLRKQKIAEFKKFLVKNNIDYLHFDENTNIFKELLNYFRIKNNKR